MTLMVGCGGVLTIVYFAVGPFTLKKARRSAGSAKAFGGPGVQTLLVTDDAGAATEGFDVVASIGSVEGRVKRGIVVPEFEATREVGDNDATSTADKWKDKSRLSNVALRVLRAAKVEAVGLALDRYQRILFLDADTYVCGDLRAVRCALDDTVAAFVPVANGKEHGKALLQASDRWRVPRSAPEANTGVLGIRNDSRFAPSLLTTWRTAYSDLSSTGFLMDQPAFRAALHVTKTPYTFLPPELNCRGHQRRPTTPASAEAHRTAVPLRCRGFPRLAEGVQTSLRGGKGCVILHSHDIHEPHHRNASRRLA